MITFKMMQAFFPLLAFLCGN